MAHLGIQQLRKGKNEKSQRKVSIKVQILEDVHFEICKKNQGYGKSLLCSDCSYSEPRLYRIKRSTGHRNSSNELHCKSLRRFANKNGSRKNYGKKELNTTK